MTSRADGTTSNSASSRNSTKRAFAASLPGSGWPRKRRPTPSTLRRLRNVAARVDHRIVVEGPLVQDVLEDLAHPNIAFHRDVEACSEMIQGRLHRREEVWRLSERGTDMLPDVPHLARRLVA